MINWTEPMFRKWYSMPNNPQGQPPMTTYSRVGMRYWRGPKPEWGYAPGDTTQYPDHPQNELRHRVERLVAQFPITSTSRILILGAGYGFLCEVFIWWKMQNGVPQATAQGQVAGLDTSAFIQANLNTETHPLMSGKIVNRSMQVATTSQTNPQRNALNSAWGGSFTGDFVIAESVDESYSDAERTSAYYTAQQSFLSAGRPLRNVIHLVFPSHRQYWGDGPNDYEVIGWDPQPDGGAVNKELDGWAATRPQHSWADLEGDMPIILGTG